MILPYLIQKEFKQMFRNLLLPVVFVLMPLVVLYVVPLIATQEIKGLKFAVVDNDHSTASQQLIRKIDASTYLSLVCVSDSYEKAMETVGSGEADLILEFQPQFGRELESTGHVSLMLSANATNGTKGAMAQSYITQIIRDYASELMTGKGSESSQFTPQNEVNVRYLFNTALDYKTYMIPALLGLILIMIVGFLPALNIVSEKEKGTIEQINVTPIRKWEFIISKMVPYTCVGLFMILESLLVSKLLWNLWPAGSVVVLLLFAFEFCLLGSSLGLIVSNYSTTLQQASLTMFFFLVIFIVMSGLITPVQSMPEWAQAITRLNPLRYFTEAMRAVFIKGSSLAQTSSQFITMAVFCVVCWFWAIISYKKNC